jgi:hypothetical protein
MSPRHRSGQARRARDQAQLQRGVGQQVRDGHPLAVHPVGAVFFVLSHKVRLPLRACTDCRGNPLPCTLTRPRAHVSLSREKLPAASADDVINLLALKEDE